MSSGNFRHAGKPPQRIEDRTGKVRQDCTYEDIWMDRDGRPTKSCRLTCQHCGHSQEAWGRDMKSINKCLSDMSKFCPDAKRKDKNFYLIEGEDFTQTNRDSFAHTAGGISYETLPKFDKNGVPVPDRKHPLGFREEVE